MTVTGDFAARGGTTATVSASLARDANEMSGMQVFGGESGSLELELPHSEAGGGCAARAGLCKG